jgi:hypothetical protein
LADGNQGPGWRALIWVGVLATALAAGRGVAVAAPPDSPGADQRAIDDALCADAILADTWNALWAMSFTVTAVGSAGYATFSPGNKRDGDTRAALYVTAVKATAGAIAKWVAPLHLDAKDFCPDGHPGSARDRRALLAEAAQREQRAVLPGIVGGLLLNSLGLLYLGHERHAWENAWLSFGVGTAVSVVSTLTAPSRAWRLNRRVSRPHHLAAMPVIGGDRIGVAIAAMW